ncbi:MAG: patatin-like phospholipase family protein, partial [Leptospirales bacterium]
MKSSKIKCVSFLIAMLLSCSSAMLNRYTHYNQPGGPATLQSSFHIGGGRDGDRTLFLLALSGGGSRAAVFASEVMLRLDSQKENTAAATGRSGGDLLRRVDAISSVSGGSLAGAYYAVSRDSGGQPPAETAHGRSYALRPQWSPEEVRLRMGANYINPWLCSWVSPENICLYYSTGYDRSDIMARVFGDRLFDSDYLGIDYNLDDLNPERPHLILNATNGTRHVDAPLAMGEECRDWLTPANQFKSVFTFTTEDFHCVLGSDPSDFPLAQAVMASATFPGAFHYRTLRNYRVNGVAERYVHVFDGGVADNLGLSSLQRLIELNFEKGGFERIAIILVDASKNTSGVSSETNDPREWPLGHLVMDGSLSDSIDGLFLRVDAENLGQFCSFLEQSHGNRSVFLHLNFQALQNDPELYQK